MGIYKPGWIDFYDFRVKYGYMDNGIRTLRGLPDRWKENTTPDKVRARWAVHEAQALKYFKKHSRK